MEERNAKIIKMILQNINWMFVLKNQDKIDVKFMIIYDFEFLILINFFFIAKYHNTKDRYKYVKYEMIHIFHIYDLKMNI